LIIEVLSSSTEAYDRGKKFAHYRRVLSLREYVLVAQDRAFVERFTRQGDEWVLTDYRHIEETLTLTSIECDVPLRAIYAKVRFPEAELEAEPPGTERLTS
jgi:Uma2 family endonuclease